MSIEFKNAIIISILIHSAIIGIFYGLPDNIERRKSLVVDYVVTKAPALRKIAELKPEARLEDTPKVVLTDNAYAAPARNERKDITQELAKNQARIKSTSDYINYYQLIREKIRRRLKENYKVYLSEGDVCLVFTLNSNGELAGCEVESEKSTADKPLREIALLSLREAAPFPAFPKGLSSPQMSFNLVVSFRKR